MKKWSVLLCSLLLSFLMIGCGTSKTEEPQAQSSSAEESETAASEESASGRQISVRAENGEAIVFELNDSPAAADLYSQLPLSVEVEDFSTNEKIFYPTEKLDIKDTPLVESQDYALAYYEPWSDVVMFYDEFDANGELYGLGQAVSGGELIQELSGTIEIDKVEN